MQVEKKSFSEKVFNIKTGEEGITFSLLAHSFFMGICVVFFETASYALFLTQFDAKKDLPYVYIVSSLITTGIGFLYEKMGERISLSKLLAWTVGFITVSITVLYIALELTNGDWGVVHKEAQRSVIMALTIWYTVLHILFNLEFWALAGHRLDVRQGKRLFGLISAGEILAGVIGGTGLEILVNRGIIRTQSLLLISAVSAGLCLFMLLYIYLNFTKKEEAIAAEKEEKHEDRIAGPRLSNKRYSFLVFSFAALSIVVFYITDYVFYDQVESSYKTDITEVINADKTEFESKSASEKDAHTADKKGSEAEIAGFLGIFAAVMGVLNFLGNTFFAGRLMTRYGQSFGLLSVPVVMVVCSFLAIIAKIFPSEIFSFFWMIVIAKLMDEVFRNTIGEPAIRILYQPFPGAQRLKIQAQLEGIVEPAAGAVTGALLLLLDHFDLKSEHLIYVMVGVLAAWTINAVLLREEYTKVWTSLVTKRKRGFDGDTILMEDGSRKSVIEGLESSEPGKVIYCLNVLEEMDYENLQGHLTELLSHPEYEVRRHVLTKLRTHNMTSAADYVVRLLEFETEPKVIGTAIQTLCKLSQTEAFEQVSPYLETENTEIRKGVLIGLLRDSGIEGVMKAGSKLDIMINSRYSEERKLAAQVLGEVGFPTFYRPLLQLLGDTDMEVRAAAIVASGKLKNPKLIPSLLENLAEPLVRSSVVPAIIAFGETVLPALEEAFDDEEKYRHVRSRIIRIIGRIGGEQAIALLKKKIDFSEENLRNLILKALVVCKYQAGEAERPMIRDKIRQEIKDAAWTLSVLLDIGDYKNAEKLIEALRNEFRKNRDKVYLLLAMVYPTDAIMSAQRDIEIKVKDKSARALEAMDNLLDQDKEIKSMVFPLIDEITLAQCRSRLIAHFPQERISPHERLKETLSRSQQLISSWTKACALFTIGKIATKEFYDTIISTLSDPDPTVRETAVWALGCLNPNDLAERLQSLTSDKNRQVADYAHFVINSVGFASIPMSKGYLTRSGRYTVELFKNILMDEEERRARRCRAANILSRFQATSARMSLMGALAVADKTVRTAALDALVKGNFEIDEKEAETLMTVLRAEISDAKRILKSILVLLPEKHSERLVHALNQEINYNRKRALSLITLLNTHRDKDSLSTIFYWYIYQDKQQAPKNVKESLEVLLEIIPDEDTRKNTLTLFQYREPRSLDRISRSSMISHTQSSVEYNLKNIAFSPSVFSLSWSRICALEMIVKLGISDCIDDIIKKLEDPDDIVRSMAAWALFNMDKEEYKKFARALRNDSSPLVARTAKQLESELGDDQEKRNDTDASDH
ncbi:MAG: hypothetical protein BWK80_19145 [Desulfobacteraceae bacterium IS3]|nr:MAG: hypothetical protein BWK80_19145 [Desulfobacteraceae bacterium IS3]